MVDGKGITGDAAREHLASRWEKVIRELREIEFSGKPGDPIYFQFSNQDVARTEEYINGEVNVDIDHYDEVVGIELLSGKMENFNKFFDIVEERHLRLGHPEYLLIPTRR